MDVSDCREHLNAAMKGERAGLYVPAVRKFLATEAASEAAALHTAQQPAADDGASSAGAGAAASRARGDIVVRALAACRFCPTSGVQGTARAFLEAPPMSIVLCANRLHSAKEVEEALVHELVHAYDMGPARCDLTNVDALAASEVRAAREAECARYVGGAAAATSVWPAASEWLLKRCCRDTATTATRAMFPREGAASVERVFERAFADLAPRPNASAQALSPASESSTA